MSRVRRLLVALAIVATGTSLLALPTSAAAASGRLTASQTRPIDGELVTLDATLATAVKRPVVLQYRSGSTWRDLRRGTTTARGQAAFEIPMDRSSLVVRVHAPAARVGSTSHRATTTPTVTLTRVAQQATLDVEEDLTEGSMRAAAKVTPARTGRTVHLQRRENSGAWTTVATAQQRSSAVGFEQVARDAADGRSFRVVAAPAGGARAATSSTRPFTTAPRTIAVEAPDPAQIGADGRLALRATTTGAVRSVRFFVDGVQVGSDDTEQPWQVDWTADSGTHDVTARAIGPVGALVSTPVPMTVPGSAIDDARGLPDDFRLETVLDDLDLPTSFAVAQDGAVLIAEKSGRILRAVPSEEGGYDDPEVVADLRDHVLQEQDRGMTGLAVDPREGQHAVYASYVARTDGDGARREQVQQVQRFDLSDHDPGDAPLEHDPDHVVLGRVTGPSCWDAIETDDCVPLLGFSHSIGDLAFDDQDRLLVGIGDGTLFDTAGGLADRTGSLRSQDPDVLAGKVLRIDPDSGRGVSGNPMFAGDGTSNRSRVLALGFRNPFRFSVHDGRVLVGDVGEGWYEEIDVIDPDHPGTSNYGWPCWEGTSPTEITWAECSDVRAEGVTMPPALTYEHTRGGSVTGGLVYTGDAYPERYRGRYFFGDYAQNFIRTAEVGHDGELEDVESFAYASAAAGPVKFGIGPDGTVWYLSIFTGELRRIVHDPTPTEAACEVGTFSRTFYDLGGDGAALTREPGWFGDGHGWIRFALATFPAEAVADGGCVDAVDLQPTSGPLHPGVPSDLVGVRWQGSVPLDAGTYEFTIKGRDWIRLWVDDRIREEWFAAPAGGLWEWPRTARVTVPTGVHNVRVELVHDVGEASADVTWRRISTPATATVTAPTPFTVVTAPSTAGVRRGAMSYEVRVQPGTGEAAASGVPRTARVVVDRFHVTGDSSHLHPFSTRDVTLGGDVETITGTVDLNDDHAPGQVFFRIRTVVTSASGATSTSTPSYVCLEGNEVGPCATS